MPDEPEQLPKTPSPGDQPDVAGMADWLEAAYESGLSSAGDYAWESEHTMRNRGLLGGWATSSPSVPEGEGSPMPAEHPDNVREGAPSPAAAQTVLDSTPRLHRSGPSTSADVVDVLSGTWEPDLSTNTLINDLAPNPNPDMSQEPFNVPMASAQLDVTISDPPDLTSGATSEGPQTPISLDPNPSNPNPYGQTSSAGDKGLLAEEMLALVPPQTSSDSLSNIFDPQTSREEDRAEDVVAPVHPQSTAPDSVAFSVPSSPTNIPVTVGDDRNVDATVEVSGAAPVGVGPTVVPGKTANSIDLGSSSGELSDLAARADPSVVPESVPAAPARPWQRHRLLGGLVVLGLIAITAVVIATTSPGSRAAPKANESTSPIQGGATPDAGSDSVSIPTNEISFGMAGTTGNICQTGGTFNLAITIDGISANTPVVVALSGADVPPSLTFQASPGVPYVKSFSIPGGGTWSDRITSIGGSPPPSDLAQASSTWQC